jgi:dinuclear metal center YbgI/SA1388 family protein
MPGIALEELLNYTNQYLAIDKIKDYCPNGLQVEGRGNVTKLVGGVTASQALIDAAVSRGADAILVHHGFFWKGEAQVITGIKKKRIKHLLENDLSLMAYHLPLDVHSECGNNVTLATLLDIELTGALELGNPRSIGLVGKLQNAMPAKQFAELISSKLGRDCQHIGEADKLIETVGFCSGAAQGMIELAVSQNLDAYISGEISEPTVHVARETGVNYFAAGHHATERGGVQALGRHLADKFGIEFEFIDIDNPV